MPITKEQATNEAKVVITKRQDTAPGRVGDNYMIIRQDFQESVPCVLLSDGYWYELDKLDLYVDSESANPTAYPLPDDWRDYMPSSATVNKADPLYPSKDLIDTTQDAIDELGKLQLHESVGEYLKRMAVDKREVIAKPAHYNSTKITAFDVIKDWGLDFFLGNVAKYLQRNERKGTQLADLKKARAYLDEKIAQLEA